MNEEGQVSTLGRLLIPVWETDLQQILAVLERNAAFHAARDSMNAELHMEGVRPSRLTTLTKNCAERLQDVIHKEQTLRIGDKPRI